MSQPPSAAAAGLSCPTDAVAQDTGKASRALAAGKRKRLPTTGLSPPLGTTKKSRMSAAAQKPPLAASVQNISLPAVPINSLPDATQGCTQIHGSDRSFTNMLNDGALSEPLPVLNLEDERTEASPPAKKKNARTANYSVDEDKALVTAWKSVSLVAATGAAEQTSHTYWSRIHEHFIRNVKGPSTRTLCSLEHRMGSILECCSIWAGATITLNNQHPNGLPVNDLVSAMSSIDARIQELYKHRNKKGKNRPFVMSHCWNLLKNNEKWKAREEQNLLKYHEKSKTREEQDSLEVPPKKTHSSISSTADFDLDADEDGEDEDEDEDKDEDEDDDERGRSPSPSSVPLSKKRPQRRKQARAKQKVDGGAYKEVLQEMVITKKEEKAEMWKVLKAIEQEKLNLEKERLRLLAEEAQSKKRNADQRIMRVDLSNLDEDSRTYFLLLKKPILASMIASSGSD